MIQRAGNASFYLPDDWEDYSIYSYHSTDSSTITMFFESSSENSDLEAILRNKLSDMMEVAPEIKIIQDISPIIVAEKEGRVVTFDVEDNFVKRTRLLVLRKEQSKVLVIRLQSSQDNWAEIENFWDRFVLEFSFLKNQDSSSFRGFNE